MRASRKGVHRSRERSERWAKVDRSAIPTAIRLIRICVPAHASFCNPAYLRQSAWCKGCSTVVVTYPAKRFVYIIRSLNHPQRRYIGVTSDVAVRLNAHNAGQNRSTAPWKPWGTEVTIEFCNERVALRFEKYLKSGAGHAFASAHFVDEEPGCTSTAGQPRRSD